ncbi:hypothetical protein [Streptomyces echinatus]|uniref:Uncharacterized protein n=1 Tax=Streptomyces echinatus TaxID=67293 RepID=A0A7W9Q363_9ACTN|nr:hypothetical protein [Streptomyces echinatus]MBB5932278.1 hypothetical protein [Streptomyces echinatus]
MARYEVYAEPQGDEAKVFPEIVVAVKEDQASAVRMAWDLQMKAHVSSCLYGIRREILPEAAG